MLECRQYRLVNRMRLAARVLGFGTMGLGATFVIAEAIGQFYKWVCNVKATLAMKGLALYSKDYTNLLHEPEGRAIKAQY